MIHNSHVLKWMRWQHFFAVKCHRQFAQLYWATQYELEGGNDLWNMDIS